MNTQHTPGPWAFCNQTLCQATGKYLHLGEWRESPGLGRAAAANARLIAAAPELFAALKTLQTMGLGAEAYRITSAAIARVTEP